MSSHLYFGVMKIRNQYNWPDDGPASASLKKYWPESWGVFKTQSRRIGTTLASAIEKYLPELVEDSKDAAVLDFGCGIGRVALDLHSRTGLPTHGCDVNAEAVAYLSEQLSSVDFKVTSVNPPLPYENDSFDAVFSISIWTHLSPEDGDTWLQEMRRVLKPGGYAFISISGPDVVTLRRERGVPGWQDVAQADLERAGALFIEYRASSHGVDGRYGLTAHDHNYIRTHWSKHFDVVDVGHRNIDGIQDLVVLRKA